MVMHLTAIMTRSMQILYLPGCASRSWHQKLMTATKVSCTLCLLSASQHMAGT